MNFLMNTGLVATLYLIFIVNVGNPTPIFDAELLALILALRKVPLGSPQKVILSGTLSECASLSKGNRLTYLLVLVRLISEN